MCSHRNLISLDDEDNENYNQIDPEKLNKSLNDILNGMGLNSQQQKQAFMINLNQTAQ